MKNFFVTNTTSKVIAILGALLVLLLAFEGGVLVGYHRGVYSYNWHMAYERGMGDPRSPFAPFMWEFSRDSDDGNAHGAVGTIVSVALPNIMIQGADSAETIVSVSPSTTVRIMRAMGSTTDFKVGQSVIVIGEPGANGQLDASFIRVIPPPGMMSSSTASTTMFGARRMPPTPASNQP